MRSCDTFAGGLIEEFDRIFYSRIGWSQNIWLFAHPVKYDDLKFMLETSLVGELPAMLSYVLYRNHPIQHYASKWAGYYLFDNLPSVE